METPSPCRHPVCIPDSSHSRRRSGGVSCEGGGGGGGRERRGQLVKCCRAEPRSSVVRKSVVYRSFAAVTLKYSQPTHCLPPTQPLGGVKRDLQSTLKLKFEDFGRFWASSLFADCSPPPAAPPMDRNIQSSLHFQSTYRRLQHCTSIHSIAFQQQSKMSVCYHNKLLE